MLSNEKSWVRPATEDVGFIVCRPAGISQSQLHARATGLLHCRQARSRHFASAMFGETAWDMLLTLYTSEAEAMTLSHLAQLVEAPPSSALRWIEYLEAQRLARRDAHPKDRRSSLVRLTPKGRAALELYLTETLEIMR